MKFLRLILCGDLIVGVNAANAAEIEKGRGVTSEAEQAAITSESAQELCAFAADTTHTFNSLSECLGDKSRVSSVLLYEDIDHLAQRLGKPVAERISYLKSIEPALKPGDYDYELAMLEFESDHREDAKKHLEMAASLGSGDAMLAIYDDTKSDEWLKKAASTGNVAARAAYATRHLSGGVKKQHLGELAEKMIEEDALNGSSWGIATIDLAIDRLTPDQRRFWATVRWLLGLEKQGSKEFSNEISGVSDWKGFCDYAQRARGLFHHMPNAYSMDHERQLALLTISSKCLAIAAQRPADAGR